MSCEFSGRCHEGFIGVSSTGDIHHCGRFADENSPLGNILSDSLTDILRHPLRLEISKRVEYLKANSCKDCSYWDLCKGGCPYHAFIVYGDVLSKTPFCPAYKFFFSKSGLCTDVTVDKEAS
jgi:uncharacterized protein